MEEVATMPSNAQEFCLRWNNFHSSLVSALDGFKNDLDFVDVTLACEGQFLKAHKMLLSACSVFFRDLLKANPCQHPIVILPPEVRFIDLEKMLRFIYQGEVNVHQENLARFLKTAEMLKIRGLAEDNEKKSFQASSPRPQDSSSSERGNDNSSVSPKRPRLSIEAQSGSQTDPSQTPNDENSRLSGPDSDSEMIPVKQEMIELKECDFETGESDSFLAEAYLREGSSATSSNNTSNTQPPQAHPAAPPPPGPLLPSYVPPPQVKSQDDSPLASNQEELSQALHLHEDFASFPIPFRRRLYQPHQQRQRYNPLSRAGTLQQQQLGFLNEGTPFGVPVGDSRMEVVIGATTHKLSHEGGKRWRCKRCHLRGHEKRTRLRCHSCGVALCIPCFHPYHIELDPSLSFAAPNEEAKAGYG